MASQARNLKNFEEFPGSIVSEKMTYDFPMLYKVDKNNNLSQWQIAIRLVKKVKGLTKQERNQNWNLMMDSVIPMESEYLENADAIPEGTIAQIWVEKGVEGGKNSRFPPSYMEAKNGTQTNARNALMSAMIYCRDKFIGMQAKGYSTDRDDVADSDSDTEKGSKKKKKKKKVFEMLYPMLAVKLKEKRDKVQWPAVGQVKIDGAHGIIYLRMPKNATPSNITVDLSSGDSDSDNDIEGGGKGRVKVSIEHVVIYSRSNKDFPGLAHIRRQILPILVKHYDWERRESLYIDGELYKHGLLLQQIVSIARNEKKNADYKKHPLEFWTFDCFYPSRTITYAKSEEDSMTFTQRYALLESLFSDEQPKLKKYPFNLSQMVDSAEGIKHMIAVEMQYNESIGDDSDGEEEIEINMRGYDDLNELNQMISLLRQHDTDRFGGNGVCGAMKDLQMVAKRYGYFVLVPNVRVESFLQFEFFYQGVLSAEFEGAMIRNVNGEYLTGLGSDDSRRSNDLQKHKPSYTKEFPVVGFTSGKGTNAGAIIWECQAHSTKFTTVPKNSSISARRAAYKELKKKKNFNSKYKGRLYTVEYEDISEDGVPLRAKGIGFRDID